MYLAILIRVGVFHVKFHFHLLDGEFDGVSLVDKLLDFSLLISFLLGSPGLGGFGVLRNLNIDLVFG